MANKQTHAITLDVGVFAKAKAQGLNVSEICNNAIHAALVEERVKDATAKAQEDGFNASCDYVAFYETITEVGYRMITSSPLVRKGQISAIKKENPDWNNEAGLLRWLSHKYDPSGLPTPPKNPKIVKEML